jgi:uncharacterized membrane protein YraQ (UPF0718 family)
MKASIAIFIGLFGFRITLMSILAGVFVGVVGGFVLGKMGLEGQIDEVLKKVIESSKNKKNK